MPTMFRKRKDANEESAPVGRVVGVRNASPAHRVAALHEREGEAAITVQKSFRGMKGRQAKWYWEESAAPRGNQLDAIDAWRGHLHAIDATANAP